MSEYQKFLIRNRNNPYIKAIKLGAMVGGVAGALYGIHEGWEFMQHHKIYQPLTDAFFENFSISYLPLYLPPWIIADEALSFVTSSIGAVGGAIVRGAEGALMGISIAITGRAFYDMVRYARQKK
jgi:hypothetical protein